MMKEDKLKQLAKEFTKKPENRVRPQRLNEMAVVPATAATARPANG